MIAHSGLTQCEIARLAGFKKPNMLTMMKQGRTKVPIPRIPALARACGVEPLPLLDSAMHEYMPDVWTVVRSVRGMPVNDDELVLLRAYRAVTCMTPLKITPSVEEEIVGVFEALRDEATLAIGGEQT